MSALQPGLRENWAGDGLAVTVTNSDTLRANLRLAGELDVASAPILHAALNHHLDRGHRFLRADLSEVSFIDTAGFDVLREAHCAFLAQRGTLILVGLNARGRHVARAAGLDTVLLIAADDPATPPAAVA